MMSSSRSIRNQLIVSLITLLVIAKQWTRVSSSERIVGGAPAPSGLYPFFAYPASTWVCGATLVWGDILITAAHCGNKVWSAGIWLGGTNRQIKLQSKFYSTKKVIVHPRYDSIQDINDIAIIQLNSFVSGPYAQVNTDRYAPAVGQEMTAIGYGRTAEGGSISNTLMRVNLTVEAYRTCSRYYTVYDDLQICNRGLPQGGKDTCNGDSGGPLFIKGTTTIAALVSFGDGCARPNTPAVNTRVSTYASWIQSTICSVSSNPPASCFGPAPVPVPVAVPVPTSATVPVVSSNPTQYQPQCTFGTYCRSSKDCCGAYSRCLRFIILSFCSA